MKREKKKKLILQENSLNSDKRMERHRFEYQVKMLRSNMIFSLLVWKTTGSRVSVVDHREPRERGGPPLLVAILSFLTCRASLTTVVPEACLERLATGVWDTCLEEEYLGFRLPGQLGTLMRWYSPACVKLSNPVAAGSIATQRPHLRLPNLLAP